MDGGDSGETCGVKGANSPLEVIPFYDVQLTWLGRWTEVEPNYPIDVTNDEAIQTGNTHDRGIAELTSGLGLSYITTKINNGNLGLTGTDPIDPGYIADLAGYTMHALALVVEPPVSVSGSEVNGSITSAVGGAKASDVEIETTGGAICNRTNTGFECIVPTLATNPRLIVSNYYKRNKTLVACSDVLDVHETPHTGETVDQNWTRFDLPFTDKLAANIVIREGGCP